MGIIRRITFYVSISAVALLFLSGCSGDKRKYVRIETPMGTMRAVLYDETPLHRDNFVKLAKEGFYDSLLFHRVIDGFMIQGGDPDSKTAPSGMPLGQGGPGYTLPAEIAAPHVKGALAAARLGDNMNPQKASSGSQFYIVDGQTVTGPYLDNIERSKRIKYSPGQREQYQTKGGTPQLDGEYTVFGQVIEGLDVIDKIAQVQVDRASRPVEDIRMRIILE